MTLLDIMAVIGLISGVATYAEFIMQKAGSQSTPDVTMGELFWAAIGIFGAKGLKGKTSWTSFAKNPVTTIKGKLLSDVRKVKLINVRVNRALGAKLPKMYSSAADSLRKEWSRVWQAKQMGTTEMKSILSKLRSGLTKERYGAYKEALTEQGKEVGKSIGRDLKRKIFESHDVKSQTEQLRCEQTGDSSPLGPPMRVFFPIVLPSPMLVGAP